MSLPRWRTFVTGPDDEFLQLRRRLSSLWVSMQFKQRFLWKACREL